MKIELTKKLLAEKVNSKVIEVLLLERKVSIFDQRIEPLLYNLEETRLRSLLKEGFFDRKFADVDKKISDWKNSRKGKNFIRTFNAIFPKGDIDKVHPKNDRDGWLAFRLASNVLDGKMSLDDAKKDFANRPDTTEKTQTKEIPARPPASSSNSTPATSAVVEPPTPVPTVEPKPIVQRPSVLIPEVKKFLREINFQQFFDKIVDKYLKNSPEETQDIVLDHYRKIFGDAILNENISISSLKKLLETVVAKKAVAVNEMETKILDEYLVIQFIGDALLEAVVSSRAFFPNCKLQTTDLFGRLWMPEQFKTDFLNEKVFIAAKDSFYYPQKRTNGELSTFKDQDYKILNLGKATIPPEVVKNVLLKLNGQTSQKELIENIHSKYEEQMNFNFALKPVEKYSDTFVRKNNPEYVDPKADTVASDMVKKLDSSVKMMKEAFKDEEYEQAVKHWFQDPNWLYKKPPEKQVASSNIMQPNKVQTEISQNNAKISPAVNQSLGLDNDENLPLAQEVPEVPKNKSLSKKLPIEIIPRISNEVFKYAIEKTKLITNKSDKEKITSWLKDTFELDQEIQDQISPKKVVRKKITPEPENEVTAQQLPQSQPEREPEIATTMEPDSLTNEPEEIVTPEPEEENATPDNTDEIDWEDRPPQSGLSHGLHRELKKLEHAISLKKKKLDTLNPNEKNTIELLSKEINDYEKQIQNLKSKAQIGPNNAVSDMAKKQAATNKKQNVSGINKQIESRPENNLDEEIATIFNEYLSKIKEDDHIIYNTLKDHEKNVKNALKQFFDQQGIQVVLEEAKKNTSAVLSPENKERIKPIFKDLNQKIIKFLIAKFGQDISQKKAEIKNHKTTAASPLLKLNDILIYVEEYTLKQVHSTEYVPTSKASLEKARAQGLGKETNIEELIAFFSNLFKKSSKDRDVQGHAGYLKKYG